MILWNFSHLLARKRLRRCSEEFGGLAAISHQTNVSFITGLEAKMERLSTQTQESGFVSMHSQRSSTQSYSTASTTNLVTKRSLQQSSSYNATCHQQQQQQQQQSHSQHRLSGETNGSSFSHRTSTTSSSSVTSSRSVHSSCANESSFADKLVNILTCDSKDCDLWISTALFTYVKKSDSGVLLSPPHAH